MIRFDTDDYITTRSGSRFHFTNPRLGSIHIDDIAHSLSMQCRYNGHCRYFYSVAEHSSLVADWVWVKTRSKQVALEALLHDAAEAYLCDVPRPIKPSLDPNYGELEKIIEKAIAEKYNLSYPWDPLIKEADGRICNDEYNELFYDHGPCEWNLPSYEPLGVEIRGFQPYEAASDFILAFDKFKES